MSDQSTVTENQTDATEINTRTDIEFGTVSGKIEGVDYELPRHYTAGMVHTEYSALCADMYISRQFANNMNGNAKARAERFEKHGKPEDAPWDESQYLTAWNNYAVNFGEPRVNMEERLTNEAAWLSWLDMISEHNACIDAGTRSTVLPRQAARLAIVQRKSKTGPSVAEYRDQWTAKIRTAALTNNKIAVRVQTHLDNLLAAASREKQVMGETSIDIALDDL